MKRAQRGGSARNRAGRINQEPIPEPVAEADVRQAEIPIVEADTVQTVAVASTPIRLTLEVAEFISDDELDWPGLSPIDRLEHGLSDTSTVDYRMFNTPPTTAPVADEIGQIGTSPPIMAGAKETLPPAENVLMDEGLNFQLATEVRLDMASGLDPPSTVKENVLANEGLEVQLEPEVRLNMASGLDPPLVVPVRHTVFPGWNLNLDMEFIEALQRYGPRVAYGNILAQQLDPVDDLYKKELWAALSAAHSTASCFADEIRQVIRHKQPTEGNRELRHSLRRRLTPWWPHSRREPDFVLSTPTTPAESAESLSPTSYVIRETERMQGPLPITHRRPGDIQDPVTLELENISEPE